MKAYMFAAEEIVQHLEKGNPMAEAVMEAFDSLFGKPMMEFVARGINRKPRTFCRARKTRVPPAKIPKLPLEEWLATQCGLPGEGVEDYLSSHPGDETIRLAREGDIVARYSLARTIGMELGIPEYENVSGTRETVLAAKQASGHPVDEAAGVSGKPLVEHVEYRKGHKDSKGEDAPWVIVSCQTGKILSSHKTKEKAEEHLGQMEYYKHAKGESTENSGKSLVESGITVNYDNGQPFDIELGQRILNNIDPVYNSLKQEIADFVGRAGATWETFKKLSLHYAVDGVPEDFNIPFCFDVEQDDDINVQVTNESYPVPGTPRPYYTRWLHWTPGLSYSAGFTFEDDTGLFMNVQEISADDDNRMEIFIEAAYEAIVACLLCLLWEKVPTEYVQADEP